MPSGAKKRKAAKKKKENQSNNHSNPSSASTHSYGDEDVKHQDDKESDVGEVSSPGSQDHTHQNLLTEGEEEEIEKERNLTNLPSAEGLRIDGGQKHIVLEESVVQVEREFKFKDESDRKDGRVEHDEATRKSYDGGSSGSSSSSSSSSDNESHGIKNSQAAADIASVVDSVKLADSLSGRSAEAIHSVPIEEAGDSVVENIPAADSEKISVLCEQVEVNMISPADISIAPYVVESVLKENGEKKLSSVGDKVGTSLTLVNAALEREEETIVQSVDTTATILDPKECVTQENDDRLTLPYNAPRATADNGAEHEKDSGVTEPLLVPSPCPVQKTSWKSCCGLFEVFSGSGR
ncbi:hypothetical protein Pfo_012737 [Paulownia fortunei]|nr:hypothetical protein Pfo_012737 [Paulownia fortunei]